MKNTINKFFVSWRKFIEKKFTQLTLIIIYFLGIGLSAIVAKMIGKKFLNKKHKNSNWQKIEFKKHSNASLEKMY
jgi:predicted permease